MSIYNASGELVLGSRLKRLGERLLGDVSRVYRSLDIPFEPSWFPLFFLLDRNTSLSVSDLAAELEITRSGASQMVSTLEKKGLVDCIPDPSDGRVRAVSLTPVGQGLLRDVKPVWKSIKLHLETLLAESSSSSVLLSALADVEENLATRSLYDRIRPGEKGSK